MTSSPTTEPIIKEPPYQDRVYRKTPEYKTKVNCVICNAEFLGRRSSVYCSEDCRKKKKALYARERNARIKEDILKLREIENSQQPQE